MSVVEEERTVRAGLAGAKSSPGKGGQVLILASEVQRPRDEAEAWRVTPDEDE
jgi:hypothetical protein